MTRTCWAFLAALLLGPSGAAEPAPPTDVARCLERNLEEPTAVRAVRMTTQDRLGSKQIKVARIYGRRTEAGHRELMVRFVEPEDLDGSALLFREREGDPEVHIVMSGKEPRRIEVDGHSAQVFGTDFSYEDLGVLEGFRQKGIWETRVDQLVSDRPVYVGEIRPEGSDYVRIEVFVDQETCVPLKVRFYGGEYLIRKELTADAASVRKVGSVFVPHSILIRDLKEGTTTQLFVQRAEHGVDLPEGLFTLDGLRRIALPSEADAQP